MMMNRLFEDNQNIILIILALVIVWYFWTKCSSGKCSFGPSEEVEGFKDYVTNTGLLPDGKYVIRGSRQKRYCTDDSNGMICNRDIPGPLEMFTLQHLEGEKYAIKGYRSGLWCSLTTTGMRCESPVVGDWEVFNLHPMGDNTYGIQSARNNKWCVDAGNGMVCDVPSMYGWDYQKFEFIPIRYNNIK